MNRAVFIDRDGTINVDHGYVHTKEKFEFIPKAVEAMQMLAETDYRIVIITNQSGIGRGMYTEGHFKRLTEHMKAVLEHAGARVDRVYYCPHDPDEDCPCRKPKTKMLDDATMDFEIDLSKSYVIGDKTADIKMGENAGCRTVLVKTGKRGEDKEYAVKPDFVAKDLYEAVEWLLKQG